MEILIKLIDYVRAENPGKLSSVLSGVRKVKHEKKKKNVMKYVCQLPKFSREKNKSSKLVDYTLSSHYTYV